MLSHRQIEHKRVCVQKLCRTTRCVILFTYYVSTVHVYVNHISCEQAM